MIKKTILVFFLFVTNSILSQEVTDRLREYSKKFIHYLETEKFDSISYISSDFLLKNDLNTFEKQYVIFHLGLNYNKIARYEDAIATFKESLQYATGSKISNVNKVLCIYNLADVYFTKKRYKESYNLIKKVINEKVIIDDYNASITSHTIMGYYHFLNLEYDKSLSEYTIAEKRAKTDDPCKVAEVLINKSKVLSKLSKFYEAKKSLDVAIKISDSCKEQINKINALKSLREVLIENGKHEEANEVYYKIEDLNSENDIENRNKKVDSLETIFKTKLKEAQNISLKKTNIQKEKENKTQRIIILATIIGLFILGLLLFYVIKLSKKEKENNHLLTKQKLDLERLNLLNQKIFSVISHDFKGPMINLELLLKLDSKKIVSEAEYTLQKEKLSNDLTQANLIMDNLLGWAKNELKIALNTSQEAKTYEACEAISKQLNYIFEEKNITLINEIPRDNIISISPDVLLIIFRNVISNALKFSFKDNNIIVSFNKTSNTYSVQDFGIGIPKNQLQKIFNTQTEATIGTNNEIGFGLGLNFVHEIIKQNNGTVWIESIENEGTIVYFQINGKPLTDNV